MRFVYTVVATLIAGLGFVFGTNFGLVWCFVVAVGLSIWSLVHRVRPGLQALDRLHWHQIVFVLLGGIVLGLVTRFLVIGPAALL